MSLSFLFGVENVVDSGGCFGGEACTSCERGFPDGVENKELVAVLRVRRLVAIGSSGF